MFIRDYRGGKDEKTRLHKAHEITLVQVAKAACLTVGWTEIHRPEFTVL